MDVETKTVIRAGMTADDYLTGARQVIDANARIAASGEAVAGSTTKATRSLVDGGGAYERLTRQLIPAIAQSQSFARGMETIIRAVEAGRDPLGRATDAVGALALKFNVVSRAAQEAEGRILAASAAGRSSVTGQAAFGAYAGVSNPTGPDDYARRAQDVAIYGRALDGLKASYNPLFAAAQTYERELAAIAAAERQGAIVAAEAAAARRQATADYRASLGANQAYADSVDPGRQAGRAASNSQAAFNAYAGVASPTGPDDYAARSQDIAAYGAALDALRAKYDPLFAVQQDYEAALLAINRAESAGAVSTTVASDARAGALASYRLSTAAIRAQISAEADLVEQSNRQMLGVKDPNAADTAKRAADIKAYGAALDDTRAKYDPLFRASKQYEATLDEINAAERAGALPVHVADDARQAANKTLAETGKEAERGGRSMHDFSLTTAASTREFIVLGHEIVVGNYSRIPGSLMVLTERVGGLGVAAEAVKGFLMSWPGVFTAIGVVGAAAMTLLVVQAEVAERRLLALQTVLNAVRSNTSAAQVDAASRDLAKNTTLGRAAALAGASTVAENPNFQGDRQQLESLVKLGQQLSLSLNGVDLQQAMELLSKGMDDAGAAAQQLLDQHHLKGLNQVLVDTIKLTQTSDPARAFDMLRDAVAASTAGAATHLTTLQQAVRNLGEAFISGGEHGKSFAHGLGSDIAAGVAGAIDALTGLIKIIGQVGDAGEAMARRQGASMPSFGQVLLTAASPLTGMGFHPLDWLTGAGAPSAGPPPATDPGVAPFIARSAADTRLDPNLLARVQASEGVLRDGKWQTSSAGAVGAMQVKPATFDGMVAQPKAYPTAAGLTDINDPAQNVAAGAAAFAHALSKYGNVRMAVLAYHEGETKMDAILAGTARASPDALAQTERVVSGYAGTGWANPAADHPNANQAPAAPSGAVTTDQAAIDAAQKSSRDVLAVRIATNLAEQRRQQAGVSAEMTRANAATSVGDDAGYDAAIKSAGEYAAKLQELKGAATDLVTTQEKSARGAEDSGRALKAEAGAARTLADIDAKYEQMARQAGTPVDAAARDRELVAAQTAMTDSLNDQATAAGRAAEAQTRLVPAIERGGLAAETAANHEKALEEARKFGERGSDEYAAAVARLEAQYNATTLAANENQAAGTVHTQSDALAVGQRELAMVNDTIFARQREVALLQERQRLLLQPGQAASPVQRRALDATAAAFDQSGRLAANSNVAAIGLATTAQRRQLPGLELGGQAAERAANAEKALDDVRKTSIGTGAEYQRQLRAEAAALNDATQAKRDDQAATDIGKMAQEAETIATETRLLGANVAVRDRELAILRERQALGLRPGDSASAEGQKAIDMTAKMSEESSVYAQKQAALGAVTGQISQSFDTMGNAIANAFITGQGAMVTFGNALKSVAEQIIQTLLKLAVLNPALNSAFGQNLPTLNQASAALSGGAAAGGLTEAGATAAIGDAPLALPLAQGGQFEGAAGLSQYSNSVVDRPTTFRFATGAGLMGEAGPEAILPLTRGPSGALGVRGGASSSSVQVNTPITINAAPAGPGGNKPLDAASMRALQAQLDQTVRQAVRAAMTDERRPGGQLARG